MCSKMIRKDERKARKIFKEIFCATRTRETQENRRGGFVRFGSGKKALVPKSGSTWKNFFQSIDFCEFLTNFLVFVFVWTFFNSAPLENGLIERETITHYTHQQYGQKNEIGEKSREIGTTKQRASRAWRWDALSPFAALLFCALLSVFIYIYISDV